MERDDNVRCGMPVVPMDVLFEIMLRLPAKSLGRFVVVSKMCASIIRSGHFIRSYSYRSSTQKEPRFLLAANKKTDSFKEDWYFFSKSTIVYTVPKPCYKETKDVETPPDVDFVSSSTVYHLDRQRWYGKPCYAHGLMLFLYGGAQFIINPSTGKSITLPLVKSKRESFLGYDPTDAQHKVLCFTYFKGFCQHQVLTLGRGKNCSWRSVQCSIGPHIPGFDSVCVDGVLYYLASAPTRDSLLLLVGFDLRSEAFDIVFEFHKKVGFWKDPTLINYNGKVALAPRKDRNVFDLWVLEDAKTQLWSKEHLSVPSDTEIDQLDFEILGASQKGEIIFAAFKFHEVYVYSLDRKSNQIRKLELEGSREHTFRDFDNVFTFLPYVECVMFI